MTILLASVVGAAGAVFRYLVAGWIQERATSAFPVGTLVVNVFGALAIGLVAGVGSLDTNLGIGVLGFLGGFTTFSTWMIETIRLGPRGSAVILNLALTLGCGVAGAAIGSSLVG